MLSQSLISCYLFPFPLTLLVKSRPIPADPINDLAIDPEKPLVYVLPFDSQVDLLVLQAQAKKLGLVDPFSPLILKDLSIPRYIFSTATPKLFGHDGTIPKASIDTFSALLQAHNQDPQLDVQVLPASILWGRKPSKEGKERPYLQALNGPQKARAILNSGRDCVVRFSPLVSLRAMADTHGIDDSIAHKLARVARIHFSRQKLAASGPSLPQRQQLIERLMHSDIVINAIEQETKLNGISLEKAQQEARSILDEIAANFSYSLIKQGDHVLSWLWHRIYQGLCVHNASTVRRLAQDGHEIVYVPCHRSHMDYLLLSYVLYHEGLVPPHIAAGINLNFFPAGAILRRGGAFFIRRSFKGNRLYSTLFREYLAELFTKGYSVEYFSEGGRSRTGRLLPAKTGMLAMTIQAMLRGLNRPVTLVPVYIGYEHVMEVATYAKELQGKNKEKENAGLVLRTLRKLHNFGKGYVNFGEPISLNHYLNEQVPHWNTALDPLSQAKPTWLNPVVEQLAHKMMTHINDAAAANALNLCATALLASRQRALSRDNLIKQVDCYLALLRHLPYSTTCTIPDEDSASLVRHAESLDKFVIESDRLGDIISLDRHQSILMTYYRNNIIHLLALPALIAQVIIRHQQINSDQIIAYVQSIYPFLQAELFLSVHDTPLDTLVEQYVQEFERQALILTDNGQIYLNQSNTQILMLLGRTISETLQRYAITLNLLVSNPEAAKSDLETQSQQIAQRLGRLNGINAPEFFDKHVFSVLLSTLKQHHYLDENGNGNQTAISELAEQLYTLLHPEVKLTIQEGIYRVSQPQLDD